MKSQSIVTEIESVKELLDQEHPLTSCVMQGLDLRGLTFSEVDLTGAVFMGCIFDEETSDGKNVECQLRDSGALIFPALPDLPYQPYRPNLYTWQELLDGFKEDNDQSLDRRIYDHFSASKNDADIIEALAQRIHDHAIDDALNDLLDGSRKPVGIMGGHSALRDDPFYRKVVETAWGLSRAGYYVVSGGGPGIMEAANLGAWLGAYDRDAIDRALEILAPSPHYTTPGFHACAMQVLEAFPAGQESLAVPTWFYGHEPSNVFGTHIAKYFSNSLREDGLLALATSGVVYAPGSAGTMQEIFMDLCQNHYKTFDVVSPMVFLGQEHYTEKTGVWPMLQRFSEGRDYAAYLSISDDPDAIVKFIQAHPPTDFS